MPIIAQKERERLTKEFAQKMVPEDLFVSHVMNAITHQEPLQPR